ncbi:MAG: hypothetical protein DGJ47_000766 [Rickettsiaceae bacterium]
MLQKLYIENFVLIEKLDLDLDKGFCVITGQTGAGKSILLDSILFAFGQKIFGQPIKSGQDSCQVIVNFVSDEVSRDYLAQHNIDCGSEIIISAQQLSNNRKKFLINNNVATQKILQDLLPILLELHSQHHHTALLDKNQHINILDDYIDAGSLKQDLAKQYQTWQNLLRQQKEYQARQDEIKQDIEYLEHICQELEKANIEDQEEEKLVGLKRTLQASGKEKEMVYSFISKLDDVSIEQILFSFHKESTNFADSDIYKKVADNLDLAYDKIEDAKSSLSEKLNAIESPEYSLDEVDDRLYLIRNLARKHSLQSVELKEFLINSQAKLSSLQQQIIDADNTNTELKTAEQDYNKLAQDLSNKRQVGGEDLAKKIMSELKFLDMKKAIFKIDITSNPDRCHSNGFDEVKFIAATNPGSKLNAIDKVASGGELARFMLAMRVSLFNNAPKKTIIFDEVDVGISGSVADSVGARIKDLSQTVQVIVITHQPQVAGKADQHILVEKTQGTDHTISKVKSLETKDRSLEIARMISGKKITDTGVKAAQELIT